MALQRCKNGHLYDPAKHTSCPYCGVAGLDIAGTAPKQSSADESHTVPKDQSPGPGAVPGLTQGFMVRKIGINPTVGWLVCIDGPERGMDYRIRPENNGIGRSETMQISIAGDDSISRENQAFISYDPRSNVYHIRPGTASGMVYHNQAPVLGPIELKPFDEIKMGETTLLFVPLCGEFGGRGFRWT